jgi:hypothetical protein
MTNMATVQIFDVLFCLSVTDTGSGEKQIAHTDG